MSDLQDIIVTSTIRAFNSGIQHERLRLTAALDQELCHEIWCVGEFGHKTCKQWRKTIELIKGKQT